jgi:hypothetical protein
MLEGRVNPTGYEHHMEHPLILGSATGRANNQSSRPLENFASLRRLRFRGFCSKTIPLRMELKMIGRKTTLILGAGASAPFGFPTGNQLLGSVIKLLTPTPIEKGVPYFVLEHANLLGLLGFSQTKISEFRKALQRSGRTSVDAFLEYRPEFIDIGKIAMAIILIGYEDEQHLFSPDKDSWYEYLFNQLNTRFDDFDKNQLSILTFNYDRSLEHFLLTALSNSYNKPVNECVKKLKSIPIIHLHGDLGGLPHLDDTMARFYEPKVTMDTVKVASGRIKIIHEGTGREQQLEEARVILQESEIICFLGFGFHPLNLERLGMKNCRLGPLGSKQICGSSLGLTNVEVAYISGQHGINLRPHRYEYKNFDVLQFLRESGVLYGYT